ncbi:hypothetical protein H7J06_27030 [Mycobacterium hodleri]|uniref:ATP-binding protein n=1 Tax=Mycolicibacterium hodleri TaxID=49897 RepID=UPI0021F2F990|nr:ATP-binding protein [Mycolicibacterium hodleri]MCV7136625.1 hypothetical protein [Mycolicibacterium hodleri]
MTTRTTADAGDRLPAPNTAEAASLYQRLRGRLAVLKLRDAAEALPAVLDQSAAQDLSMTAALDRLLSIEVEATEARRLAGRLRFACLPTPASLEDFDYDAAAGVDRLLHRSVVLNPDGNSYRLRDHNARAEKLRRTTTGTRQPLQ